MGDHAMGVVQLDPSNYSHVFESCSHCSDTYLVEIDCRINCRTDKQFLLRLVEVFNMPFFLDEHEVSEGLSMEDIVLISDIFPSLLALLFDISTMKLQSKDIMLLEDSLAQSLLPIEALLLLTVVLIEALFKRKNVIVVI